MGVAKQIKDIEKTLAAEGDHVRAAGEKAYLKSPWEFHGVKVPEIRRLAKHWLKEHDLGPDELIAITRAAHEGQWHDLRTFAHDLLELRAKVLRAGDTKFLRELVELCQTWDHVDHISTKVIAPVVERHDSAYKQLRTWSRHSNFWVRRASMLALLPRLRDKKTDDVTFGGDFALFAEFASAMIEEKEFFIRKAIGWILREVSKRRPAPVADFLTEHINAVSGLTLREGSKYLPAKQRDKLMAAYKAR